MRPGDPVGWPGLIALGLGFVLFLAALYAARLRGVPKPEGGGGKRANRSWIGIVVQGLGIGLCCFGPQNIALDPASPLALGEAAIVALLMAATVGLFFAASRTMGRNWSLVARTRSDHSLVTDGPFAFVRHPIYVALFLLMLALAIAFGHTHRLLYGVPIFALGTWLRIGHEERLLRDMFGTDYDAYAARVKRFVPGIF
ncbi:isoprenylcysteine carboxyl methyltransferase [Sphingomonas sp. Leaf357]|uniref:methyltransferase family protein n=1 Tax=Sphingomonas sp. Leaf357 TaxID=1736350 RepID=UPI0006FEF665|nr:isoprenylcysteine carboxylmethyltransferase family protein [Sphingomonas sp. Leaf357]KQS01460.1 isoprenylcysteine carboxyl methyltransferase [Sphingomonas sp. Leaf357]